MFAECSMVSQRNNQAITFCLQFVFYRRRPNRREWPKGGDEGLYGREWDAVRREGSFRPCKCTLWRRSSGLHALSFYSISNLKYSVQKNSALQIFKVFFSPIHVVSKFLIIFSVLQDGCSGITVDDLKDQLQRHEGLLENLTISIGEIPGPDNPPHE